MGLHTVDNAPLCAALANGLQNALPSRRDNSRLLLSCSDPLRAVADTWRPVRSPAVGGRGIGGTPQMAFLAQRFGSFPHSVQESHSRSMNAVIPIPIPARPCRGCFFLLDAAPRPSCRCERF